MIMTMEYFDMGLQYLTALFEIGFLYIWLRTFSERRNLNRGIIAAVILCFAAVRYYSNCMENAAPAMVFEISCSFLISLLLYTGRYRSLFFYTITNYALGVSAEGLFIRLLNAIGADGSDRVTYLLSSMLVILAEMALWSAIYCSMRMLSSKTTSSLPRSISAKPRYNLKQYMMFYSVPIAVCSFTAWINALGDIYDGDAGMGFVPVMAEAAFIIADTAALYLHEMLSAMMIKAQALEKINVRLEMEARHYQNMDNLHEQYDTYIHDIKHTMRTIAALSEEGDCERISGLINKMRINIGNIEQKTICSDKVLNALLLERKGYAEDNGIMMETEIREPLYLQEIDDTDLIALMGNLLDNAIEAEKRSGKREGIILSMKMAREGRHVLIHLENSYEEKYSDKVVIKRNEGMGHKHGIGLGSIRDIVRKYGGIIETDKYEGRYLAKVILPVQSKWENQESYSNTAPAYLQLLSK